MSRSLDDTKTFGERLLGGGGCEGFGWNVRLTSRKTSRQLVSAVLV